MNKINKINVCCQKVLPLVYDESLSYYEVLCKVIQKLNELIKINNNIRDEIHKEYVEILETAKQVTEAITSVTSMRDEVLTLKQATEQYANDVVTVYNETVQARDTAIAKAESAEQSATTATQSATSAERNANRASQSATVATQKAESAEQSANTATQKANSASQSATVATQKASEAQTSATNAKQYADEAKESASLVGQDVTDLKNRVSSLETDNTINKRDISNLRNRVSTNESNISDLQTDISNYWKTLYPIGSIYISTSSTFNPNTAWGGTWVKTADGRCLIGANSTYPLGSTGGEAEHTLSLNEIPSHDHNLSDWAMSWKMQGVAGEVNINTSVTSNAWSDNHGFFKSQTSKATGGGQAHNNMQPYLAVYIWKRTA